MGFLSKLFSSGGNNSEPVAKPKDFLECLSIVRAWSSRAAIDPDFDMNDRSLNIALNTPVTCPYCNAHYAFGQAVHFSGASMEVQCPSCKTKPRQGYQNSN
ncbi:MAG: hypothetical protein OEZ68_06270 [Gammaproteobacteria bacterium]|nr:hypothetical protein [Gammaproteobacteria bacterium]MDH5800395.1 hypothetical protein [Gammaproteobacteria bacterium]